jgi:predicted RNA binding protein YcfA (HicA-like mRNA interferase family)
MVDWMSRREKLLKKLFKTPPPKDFTWSELKSLLEGHGFEMTKGSGSRRKFFHKEKRCLVTLDEPHPKNTILVCYVTDVVKALKRIGIKP